LKKVFRKRYIFKCSKIRETLPFVKCDLCKFRFKKGRLEMGNILVKNLRKLSGLTSPEAKVVLLLGTIFDGENPSISKIALEKKMNYQTVDRAMTGLTEKGILK